MKKIVLLTILCLSGANLVAQVQKQLTDSLSGTIKDYRKSTTNPLAPGGSVVSSSSFEINNTTDGSQLTINLGMESKMKQVSLKAISALPETAEQSFFSFRELTAPATIEVGFRSAFWHAHLNRKAARAASKEFGFDKAQSRSKKKAIIADAKTKKKLHASKMVASHTLKPGLFELGGTFGWQKQSFRYSTDNSLTNVKTTDRSALDLQAFVTYTPNAYQKGAYFRLGVSYLLQHAGGTQLQPAGDKTTPIYLGEPTEEEDLRVRLEYIGFIDKKQTMGINPRFSYTLEQETLSFELPIYMFSVSKTDDREEDSSAKDTSTKKKSPINAGFVFKWNSDAKDVAFKSENFDAGIFIGLNLEDLFVRGR